MTRAARCRASLRGVLRIFFTASDMGEPPKQPGRLRKGPALRRAALAFGGGFAPLGGCNGGPCHPCQVETPLAEGGGGDGTV